MNIQFLGGAREVGRSAFFIDSEDGKILLDYGVKLDAPQPEYPMKCEKPDGIIISHSHLDHCGAVPTFFRKPPYPKVYSTSLTFNLTHILLKDSLKIAEYEGLNPPFNKAAVAKMKTREVNVPYRKKFKIKDATVELFDGGHIPGAALTRIETEGKSIFYTGDFNTVETDLVPGCDMDFPESDVLIIESTYADTDHPEREKLEKEMIDSISETLDKGGVVLMPAFAIGRSQEILLMLDEKGMLDNRVYLDGMSTDVLGNYLNFSNYINHSKRLNKMANKITSIKNHSQRKEAINGPSIIISTAGMMEGGPVMFYMEKLFDNPHNKIVLTGYQVEDTNGDVLLREKTFPLEDGVKKVKSPVERYDFSAHVGKKGIMKMIEKVNPDKIFLVHGDPEKSEAFEKELNEKGWDATAPNLGDSIAI